jgi:adenylate cyclase
MLSQVESRSTSWQPYGAESGSAVPEDAPAFMFTDIEGYTSLIERLGDTEAHKVVQTHDDIVRGQLEPFGGREVEQHGDAFLLVFGCAGRALFCAITLQRAFATYSRAHPEHPIRIRIGLHKGSALRSGQGFFGKSVVTAARIAAQAKGGEILVSQPVLRAACAFGEIVSGEPREVALKGLNGFYRLHPVLAADLHLLRG